MEYCIGYAATEARSRSRRGPAVYSMDLKVRILEACQAGENSSQAAQRFSVSPGLVAKLMKLFRETGSLVVLEKEKRGPKFRFTSKPEEKLGKLVSKNPGMNARQLRYKLRVDASPRTMPARAAASSTRSSGTSTGWGS